MHDTKRTVLRLYDEVLSRGRLDLLPELLSPDYPDAAGFVAVIGELRGAFPDIRYTLDEPIAEGDRVAVRWEWTGTHRGAFRAFQATGKHVTNTGMGIFTLRDGRITRSVLETDRLGFTQQVGAASAA